MPLALMISDGLGPYHCGELGLVTAGGLSSAFGGDRVDHHIFRACQTGVGSNPLLCRLLAQALKYNSLRKLSPVDIIAQAILASLLASATATTRSGFLARIATIHSARAPLCLPPLECWLGVNPSEAEKSLPDLNALGSGLNATIAEAISAPKAGISSRRRLTGLLALASAIFASSASILASSPQISAANVIVASRAASGRRSSASTRASRSLIRWMPLAATRPNSERWPRNAFTLIVRCLTMSSRVLCSISTACWPALLIGTNRMSGRDIASQIAAASLASFLPRLRYALT